MGAFFEWFHELYASSPILAGLVVPVYMAAVGVIFALVADVAVRFTGIHLGDYKKEYDEILEEQEGKAGAR